MIWGTWSQYSKITLIPQLPRTGITEPSDGLYTWVGGHYISNLSWGLTVTSCVSLPLISDILDHNPTKCLNRLKTGKTQPSHNFWS